MSKPDPRDAARAAAECKIWQVQLTSERWILVAARTMCDAAKWAQEHMNTPIAIEALKNPAFNAMTETVVVGSDKRKR